MKKNNLILSLIVMLSITSVNAQVKVGNNPTTINSNSVLELETTNKGLLMPRVNLTATNSASPLGAFVVGMTVYNMSSAGSGATAVEPGYYYCDGTKWVSMVGSENFDGIYDINATPPSSGTTGITTYTDPDGTVSSSLPSNASTSIFTDPNGIMYTWDGTKFVTYKSKPATAWYAKGTTNDAGANKTGAIYRPGRVGIGTNNPLVSLHVDGGDARVVNAGKTVSLQPSNATTQLQISTGSGNASLGVLTAASGNHPAGTTLMNSNGTGGLRLNAGGAQDRDIEFWAYGTTMIMHMDGATGKVGVGTNTPTQKLSVAGNILVSTTGNSYTGNLGIGTASASGVIIENGVVSAQRPGVNFMASHPSGQANGTDFMSMWLGGSNIGNITQNSSSSVVFNTTSDIRLKENIKPTHYGLADLMKIQVADYNYIVAKDEPTTGFLAQQLHSVYPDAVSVGGENAQTNPWMIDYGKLTPLLVKAMQDQQAILQQQQEQIEFLKLEIENLKKKN